MKILVQGEENRCKFSVIELGDLFEYKGIYFIRIKNVMDGDICRVYNALNLEANQVVYFNDDDIVTPVNGYLVIER